jgi:hypothetical protein
VDSSRFDRLTRALALGASRRSVIKGLLGIGVASTATGALIGESEGARRGTTPNVPPAPTLPTQTPTPAPTSTPACASGQVLCNGVCCSGACTATGSCCASGNTVCGPDCCAPGGQCCDSACCYGTCYGEELCCPSSGTVCGAECCDNATQLCCDGACVTGACCSQKTCDDYPGQCGDVLDDGCGGTLDCTSNCPPPSTCNGTTCTQPGACAAGDDYCTTRALTCGFGNCACFQTVAGATVCSAGVYGKFGCGSCHADSDCPAQTGNPNSVCVTTDDVCTTCSDGGVCAALCPFG